MAEVSAAVALPRRKSKVKKSEALWLMSFSDMCLILMSFFVLQLSFSTLDRKKFESINDAMQSKAAGADAAGASLAALQIELDQTVKAQKLDKTVQVTYDVHGLAIELKDALVFETGSATSSEQHREAVDKVMRLIADGVGRKGGDYRLVLEGHTDDVPVKKGPGFASNWELSAARGIALLEQFKARGVPEGRMSVASYGPTRAKLETKGLSGEALKRARAANRRVVIRIQ